jgi:hypothetical protein|nr:MAG TPA: nucleoid-associated protein [Caudoviricetes sp.]
MQKTRKFKAAFTCRWAPSDGKDGENGKDGIGIKSADVVFTLSTSNTTPPADSVTWVTLFSQLYLMENTYVWSCTKTVLTSGATTYTGKQCLGASKDFATITEQYAVGSSGITAPTSGWGTSYTPTKELWLWTRNRIRWTSGAYTYTTAICIGYFGKDGDKGDKGDPGKDGTDGKDGENGKDGTDGKDGNGISTQTTYFIATDQMKVASYSSVYGWSTTFPTATEQKPYVWKCVKTTYTKSGTTYSTPELITTYHSGDNANIIDNAAFTSADNMSAWWDKSVYSELSGKTAPSDKGKVDTSNRKDNHNSYYDTCKATGATINYKDILEQTVHQPSKGINKLAGGQWYTFSFWAKGYQQTIWVNETSSSYGFATKELYLVAGRTYNIAILGKIDATALANGKELRTFIYNDGWSEQNAVAIKSTSQATAYMTFTPKTTGRYKITSYMYDNTAPRTGTVTVYTYSITDSLDLTTYIYPSAVDTNTKMIVDGSERGSTPSDLGVTWALTGQWKRHTVTFKTKSSFSSTEAQNVLFRFQPAPNEEAYRQAWICMPKLESGMFATGFVDGIDDLRGIPGLIERTSEWSAGTEYHNDESLSEGIRYLDIVTVTDNTTGNFTMYQCRVTHTSTTANAPNGSDNTEWLKLNQMRPIYTPLIVTKNAVLRFAQTNRILITNSKDTVQGCFGGVEDETNGYPLWIGGITAAAAKFRVKYGGQLEATEASITGTVNATSGTFTNVKINSGTIGGFTISGNGLTNDKNFNDDAYIILRNDNAGAFAGIGGNLLPASSGLRAVARFQNENKSRWFEYGSLAQNIAMMLSAKNADRNYALSILGGCIKGFALNTSIITSKTYTISRDENVVSYISDSSESGDWVDFTLPDMQWYDEGHFVMLSREAVGSYTFRVKPGYCYDKNGNKYETYIYNKGRRYTRSNFDLEFFSAYGSCILVYCPRWSIVSKNAVLNKGIWLAYGVQ